MMLVSKYNNENLVVCLGVGLWGTPLPLDYDNDGLTDIIMSCPDAPYKGIYLYKNIGTKQNPLFDKSVKLSDKSFQNVKASYINGDLRVLRQNTEYQNFKSKLFESSKKLKVDTLPGFDFKKMRSNMWSFVDFDNDNNQDILVSVDDWGDYGWDNAYDKSGNWTNGPLRGFVYWLELENGIYKNRGKTFAGKKPLETYGAPNACFADFNGDGKPELICGEFLDKFTWYNNTGKKGHPIFDTGKQLTDAKGQIIRMHVQMITPVAYDFNDDGHIDLVVGDEDGRVALIKNTGKVKKGMPVFATPEYLKQKADNVKFGALSTPYSIDWDGDGLEDIICGNSAGNIAFIKNLTGGNNPKWAEPVLLKTNNDEIRIMAGKNGSIQGPAEEKWGYTTLTVADWDNDDKPDIIVNSIFGEIIWYKNTGDAYNVAGPYKVKVDWEGQVASKPVWNWWNPGTTDLVTQWRTTPFAIDWNHDGLTDLVMLDNEGYLAYYERFEKNGEWWLKPGKRVFYMLDIAVYDHNNKPIGEKSSLLQLNGGVDGKSGRRKFTLVDWNKDGKIDLLVNSTNVCYFENVKQDNDTVYFVNKGDISGIRLAGHDTSPTAVDWDKDGVFDVLVGAEDGHFYMLKNNVITK
ncbi:MAG: VCBS repeat-containing protein [Paludibacteraceae bacterium]